MVIACSGLGHVRRGNETWATDAASALHAAGVDILLVGGGPRPEGQAPYLRLPNLRRDFPVLRRVLSWHHRYLAEQLSFLLPLRRRLLRDRQPIVHLCDPDLALQLQKRTPGRGLHVAFKDGMLLGPEWCRRIEFVHVLAPHYRDVLARDAGVDTRDWFVIPHLVDVRQFQAPADRAAERAGWPELNLPPDALVVLGVGDFSTGGHKRLDWLVREVAALPPEARAHLVLAGQADPDTFACFETAAHQALGTRVRLLRNLPRHQIARLYRVADVFAHAATREPFGIVFLEAMASGLPIVGHPWEVTRWIIGDAGETPDMTVPGALAAVLRRWAADVPSRLAAGTRARLRAESAFAPGCVVPRYLELYDRMRHAGSPAA